MERGDLFEAVEEAWEGAAPRFFAETTWRSGRIQPEALRAHHLWMHTVLRRALTVDEEERSLSGAVVSTAIVCEDKLGERLVPRG